jgi:hypothetical protein
MDAHELIIAIEWAKHLVKKNGYFDMKLCCQAYDLKKSTKTIEHL